MIEWIAMPLSITGSILSASAGRFSESNMRKAMLATYILWAVANLLWLVVSTVRSDLSQMALWSVFLGISVVGLIRWRR